MLFWKIIKDSKYEDWPRVKSIRPTPKQSPLSRLHNIMSVQNNEIMSLGHFFISPPTVILCN